MREFRDNDQCMTVLRPTRDLPPEYLEIPAVQPQGMRLTQELYPTSYVATPPACSCSLFRLPPFLLPRYLVRSNLLLNWSLSVYAAGKRGKRARSIDKVRICTQETATHFSRIRWRFLPLTPERVQSMMGLHHHSHACKGNHTRARCRPSCSSSPTLAEGSYQEQQCPTCMRISA